MTAGIGDAVPADGKAAAREHVRAWLGHGRPAVIRINGADTPWYDDDLGLIAACPGAVPAVMVPKAEDPARLAALSLTLPAGTGIIPLVDGVTTDLTDESVLEADLKHAVTLGFTAQLCIHPGQARGVIAAGQDGAVEVRNSQMIDRPVVLRAEAILARAARTGVINYIDEFAIEAGLRLAEAHGGEVTIVTGPGADAAVARLAEYGAEKIYVADSPDFGDLFTVVPQLLDDIAARG